MSVIAHHKFPNFFTVDHPLIAHKLSLLRDKHASKKMFKELVNELTLLLAYEATKNLPIHTTQVDTPLMSTEALSLQGKKPVILPILRAGLGMVDGFLSLMPAAKVGHIGLYRNEDTLKPTCYYFKIPTNSQDRQFFICDPMLATGGSAIDAIGHLKDKGIQKMIFICLVAAPEGVKNLSNAHPDLPIFCASLDHGLNDQGYIYPGLGDAGDRLFGTI